MRTRAELAFYIRADLAAQQVDRWRARYRLTNRVVYFQWLLRRCEYWEDQTGPAARLMSSLLQLRLHLLGERLGFTIPRHVIGPGLSIVHKGTIVINRGARIGRNFRVHQGVTVAQSAGAAPRIGDNVWVAAGAQILGDVTVGSRSAIAANAVVTRDVPEGKTVGGIPAKVISDQSSARLLIDACAVVQHSQ
jgi:serine O-acetyltransferase